MKKINKTETEEKQKVPLNSSQKKIIKFLIACILFLVILGLSLSIMSFYNVM